MLLKNTKCRTQRVEINSFLSKWMNVLRKILQNAVLGQQLSKGSEIVV